MGASGAALQTALRGEIAHNEYLRLAVDTGLLGCLLYSLAVWSWIRDEPRLHLEWWTAEIVSGTVTPAPAEVQNVEWMTIETIRNHPGVLPNNINFLDYAQSTGILPKPRNSVS